MVKFWNSCISEWEGWLTLHKGGGSRSFMTMIVTKVRCMDTPGSDWGDFSCRRAVDSSSLLWGGLCNTLYTINLTQHLQKKSFPYCFSEVAWSFVEVTRTLLALKTRPGAVGPRGWAWGTFCTALQYGKHHKTYSFYPGDIQSMRFLAGCFNILKCPPLLVGCLILVRHFQICTAEQVYIT